MLERLYTHESMGKATIQCFGCAEHTTLRWRDNFKLRELIEIHRACLNCGGPMFHVQSVDYD